MLINDDRPYDSATSAYLVNGVWTDEDGYPILDLKYLGFSTLQRETILLYIHQHIEDEFVSVPNAYGDPVELYWRIEDFRKG